jgi:phage I-like protein
VIRRSVIALSGDKTPPSEERLFKFGVNDTMKGKFILDRSSVAEVMSRHREHKVDLMLDYEHHSLDANATPEQKKASGWGDLEVREDGLWLVNIKWTPTAAEYLKNSEFRYLSPAFNVDDENRIIELINVALTNLPATHDAPALVAASRTRRFTVTIQDHMKASMEKHGGHDGLAKHLGWDSAKLTKHLAGDPMTHEEMSACSEKLGFKPDEADEKHAMDGVDVNKMEPGMGLAGLFEHLSGEAAVPHDSDEADENQHGGIKASRRNGAKALLSKLVKLTGKDDPEALVDYVMSLMGTAEKYKGDSEQLGKVRQGVEADYRKNMIEANKAKLTPSLIALSRSMPIRQFKELIDALPTHDVELSEPAHTQGDKRMITLSAVDKEVCKLSGTPEDKFAEFKETLSASELNSDGRVAGHKMLRGDREPQSTWDMKYAVHFQTLSLTGLTPEGKAWKPAPGSVFRPAIRPE